MATMPKGDYITNILNNKNTISLMPPKNPVKAERLRTELFKQPFPHMLVMNFLSPEIYKKTLQVYDKLEFKQKSSDLFHFFQTYELNQYKKLDYFKEELDKQFWRLPPMNEDYVGQHNKDKKEKPLVKNNKIKKEDTFYNIFASYYFEGDYLLCHDDVVEDRLYAFSYYLEDHPSADLVLFNKHASEECKRIKVTKNTLAIFQVSDVSYHQVDYCHTDGRKAITGWFNIRGLGDKRKQKTIPRYMPEIPAKSMKFPLPSHYLTEQYFQLMNIQYQFNVSKCVVEGPFYQRRVHKILIEPCVVFELPGYKLLSVEFYSFKEGDYILLNDPINKIEGQQNIIDIFVTKLSEGFVPTQQAEEEDEEGNMLVKIVQEEQQPSGIPEIDDSLFIVQRGKKQYYVERVAQGKQFMIGHFIYVPDEKKKEKKVKKQVSQGKLKNDSGNVGKKLQKEVRSKKAKNMNKEKEKEKAGSKKKPIKRQKTVKKQIKRVGEPKQKSKLTRKIKKTK